MIASRRGHVNTQSQYSYSFTTVHQLPTQRRNRGSGSSGHCEGTCTGSAKSRPTREFAAQSPGCAVMQVVTQWPAGRVTLVTVVVLDPAV